MLRPVHGCSDLQLQGAMGCAYVGNSFEISELGNRLKSLVSSVVNIVTHFTDGLSYSRNRYLLTGSSLICSVLRIAGSGLGFLYKHTG